LCTKSYASKFSLEYHAKRTNRKAYM
jgi:hypothetical protein